jgi:hypothetical protein
MMVAAREPAVWFSTELATGVLEIWLASLAIPVPYLLFFGGLRALA